MIFSNDTSVFIPESSVSDNPIRNERPRMTTNTTTELLGMITILQRQSYDLGHAKSPTWFDSTSSNGLYCRSLVVEVPESPGFFTNHHGTTRIRADVSTVLPRLMLMHHDLIKIVNV